MEIESERLILRHWKEEYVDECITGLLNEEFVRK